MGLEDLTFDNTVMLSDSLESFFFWLSADNISSHSTSLGRFTARSKLYSYLKRPEAQVKEYFVFFYAITLLLHDVNKHNIIYSK